MRAILNSLGAVDDPPDWDLMVKFEQKYITEKADNIVWARKEYSEPVYTDMVNHPRDASYKQYVDASVNNIKSVSHDLASEAHTRKQELLAQKDISKNVKELAAACYDLLASLAAEMHIAVENYPKEPITDPYDSSWMKSAVNDFYKAYQGL